MVFFLRTWVAVCFLVSSWSPSIFFVSLLVCHRRSKVGIGAVFTNISVGGAVALLTKNKYNAALSTRFCVNCVSGFTEGIELNEVSTWLVFMIYDALKIIYFFSLYTFSFIDRRSQRFRVKETRHH